MAFRAEPVKERANYFTIKEGTFRLPSHKDDPQHVRREYKNPKTGEEGVAYERAYKALYGVIEDVSLRESTLRDGTVLRNINIHLGYDDDGVAQIVSIPQSSRYAVDFLKRLPKVRPGEEVRLMPFDFEKDGPRRVGISIAHRAPDSEDFTEVVPTDFFTKVEEKDGEKRYTNLHGFPEATEEDASDWQFYFKKVEKFLISYNAKNVFPKFQREAPKHSPEDALDEIFDNEMPESLRQRHNDPDAIPF